MAGLTAQGFVKKTLPEIKLEIEERLRTRFGIFINLLPGSVFATLVGIFSERESLLWDALEAKYNSAFPDTASGVNLDNVVAYNGLTRLAAARSRIENVLLFGLVGTEIPLATIFSVSGNPTARFETLVPTTLVAGADAEQLITFSAVPDAGDFSLTFKGEETAAIAFDDVAADVKAALELLDTIDEVTVSGNFTTGFTILFGGNNGKQPQPLIEVTSNLTLTMNPVDASVSNNIVGVAQGVVEVQALDFGPVDAPINSLTVINTPVDGLNRIDNPEAVVLGRFIETDAELRARRSNTLAISGSATIEAIRSTLLNIQGVIGVLPFENTTLVVDGDGLPAKSFEMVVDGGEDQDIFDSIWETKPAGIETFGNQEGTVIDSLGDSRTVFFSRPVGVPIYLSLDLTTNGGFPVNGVQLVRNEIFDYGKTLSIGEKVVVFPTLVAQLAAIPGITDVRVRIDTDPVSTTPNDPALDDNIIVGARERAEFSLDNIQVNLL